MIEPPPKTIMVISHIQPDKTGMGNLPNGEVTKGLYEHFERMAQPV